MICEVQYAKQGNAIILRQVQEKISQILNAIRAVQHKYPSKKNALPIPSIGRASVVITLK
jgi:hypothetical protein